MPRDGALHLETETPQEIRGAVDRRPPIGAACAAVLLHVAVFVGVWAWRPMALPEPEAVVVSLEFLPAPSSEARETKTGMPPAEPTPPPKAESEPAPDEPVEALPEKSTSSIPPPPHKPAPPRTVANPAPVTAPSTMPPVPSLPMAAARPATTAQPPYTAVLLAWLERHRVYPRAARVRGIEGQVIVRIALDREGKLLASALTRASGHGMLDDAALETVRRAAPFPPLLETSGGPRFEFLVPVDFALQR